MAIDIQGGPLGASLHLHDTYDPTKSETRIHGGHIVVSSEEVSRALLAYHEEALLSAASATLESLRMQEPEADSVSVSWTDGAWQLQRTKKEWTRYFSVAPAVLVKECPRCGGFGPHLDNGAKGIDLSYCCPECGEHFDAEPV